VFHYESHQTFARTELTRRATGTNTYDAAMMHENSLWQETFVFVQGIEIRSAAKVNITLSFTIAQFAISKKRRLLKRVQMLQGCGGNKMKKEH
jgi:hypothetical protein